MKQSKEVKRKNIWNKVKKSNKIVQVKKILIFAIPSVEIFLILISQVLTL